MAWSPCANSRGHASSHAISRDLHDFRTLSVLMSYQVSPSEAEYLVFSPKTGDKAHSPEGTAALEGEACCAVARRRMISCIATFELLHRT